MYDINQDGLPDLLVGEEIGNINYFENNGTPSEPAFASDPEVSPNTKNFGLIDSRQGASVFGFSAPAIVVTPNETLLTVGSKLGNFLIYALDAENANNPVQIADHPIAKIKDGERSKAQFADLNEDGYYEMMTGNSRGGIVAYRTGFRSKLPLSSLDRTPAFSVDVSPNPTTRFVQINTDERIEKVVLIDVAGKTIRDFSQDFRNLALAQLRSGIYFIKIVGKQGIVVKKIMKTD